MRRHAVGCSVVQAPLRRGWESWSFVSHGDGDGVGGDVVVDTHLTCAVRQCVVEKYIECVAEHHRVSGDGR